MTDFNLIDSRWSQQQFNNSPHSHLVLLLFSFKGYECLISVFSVITVVSMFSGMLSEKTRDYVGKIPKQGGWGVWPKTHSIVFYVFFPIKKRAKNIKNCKCGKKFPNGGGLPFFVSGGVPSVILSYIILYYPILCHIQEWGYQDWMTGLLFLSILDSAYSTTIPWVGV